jgi:hypothetical protein
LLAGPSGEHVAAVRPALADRQATRRAPTIDLVLAGERARRVVDRDDVLRRRDIHLARPAIERVARGPVTELSVHVRAEAPHRAISGEHAGVASASYHAGGLDAVRKWEAVGRPHRLDRSVTPGSPEPEPVGMNAAREARAGRAVARGASSSEKAQIVSAMDAVIDFTQPGPSGHALHSSRIGGRTKDASGAGAGADARGGAAGIAEQAPASDAAPSVIQPMERFPSTSQLNARARRLRP